MLATTTINRIFVEPLRVRSEGFKCTDTLNDRQARHEKKMKRETKKTKSETVRMYASL